jgi:hypothetical protein
MDSVMAKKKPSRQRLWTKDEVRELRALAKQRLTTAIIARRLKRSLDSTKRKASVLGVPLGAAVRWTKETYRNSGHMQPRSSHFLLSPEP